MDHDPSLAPSVVPSELVPKPVVAAIITQLALSAVDLVSLAMVALAVLGMTQSTEAPADADVDAVMRLMVVGYGVSSSIGLALGVASSAALYRGATWGRTAAFAHGAVTILSCCPCNWAMAVFAIIAANHPDVRAWPALPARDLVDTFR